jgi:arginine/lysine/ornithine decarboxylase
MIETPIHDFLKNYTESNTTRCHMPGHKGREFKHDITEIEGAIDIIAESERIAARLFGAKKTLYSCSGSTLAIQAMLALVKLAGGKKIAAFRGVHGSFISACALLDFDVDWIYDEFSINSGTAAVFANSLDYYGEMRNLKSIANICKKADVPLLVDNAHGAYLALTVNCQLSIVNCHQHPVKYAAMCADSAHKTLPALTGAAYLHINDERFTEGARAALDLFATTSPSYLILESLDLCNKHIAEGRTEAFKLVEDLKQSLSGIGFSLRESDLLRITVNARDFGYSGIEFASELRKNKAECEYADENCTVLLFSTITEEAETKAVLAAFRKIRRKAPLKPVIYPLLRPEKAMSIRNAFFAPDCKILNLKAGIGKICAEIIAPCPPGVPLIMPGEIISAEGAELLENFGVEKIRVI